jgi:tetratricopeptide (TPR) repeat protein
MNHEREQLQAAFHLYQQGKLVEAANIFEQLIRRNPNNHDALHYLGILKTSQGQFAEAKQLLERSLATRTVNLPYVENYVSVLFKIGDYQQAVNICTKTIKENGKTETLQYVLAVSLFKLNRLKEANDEFDALLLAYPRHLVGMNEKASTLAQLKRYDEALLFVDKALSIDPGFAEALLNKGNILVKQKKYDDSILIYKNALSLNGSLFDAYRGLGSAWHALKDYEKALPAYDKALALKPDLAEAWLGRGDVFTGLRLFDDAFSAFDRAVALKPDLAEGWLSRGNALAQLKRWDEALAAFDSALALKPDLVGAWLGRGNVLSEVNRFEEAIAVYDKALALEPELAEAWAGRGNVFNRANHLNEACADYDKALAIDGNYTDAIIGRGIALNELKRYDEACADFDHAIKIDPTAADAYWNKALLKLCLGHYEEGWDLYEWRSEIHEMIPFAAYLKSLNLLVRQNRSALKDKKIAVLSEQGVGDEIMFASTLPDLTKDARTVDYEVDQRLARLFVRAFPGVNIIPRGNLDHFRGQAFDVNLRSGSLGYAYRRGAELFPGSPYLSAEPDRISKWRERLSIDAGGRKKIGVSWRGGGDKTRRNLRSLELAQLSRLIDRDDCYFVSLQYGNVHDEIMQFNQANGNNPVHCLLDDFNNFDDFAALITALDLVISVQNTTIHMCGALGKTCWGMIPWRPEWRYGSRPHNMIWYSSVTLYRQEKAGDWGSLIRLIDSSLQKFSSSK